MRDGNAHTGRGARRQIAGITASLLLLGSMSVLGACRPTDFFTEVIITPDAETVDEGNVDKTVVNSPDAERESNLLAALDWSDDAHRTTETQNLVTYSDDPNSDLSTHHSLFDLSPRFPGIQASDGVRLVYDADSATDHSSDAADENSVDDAESTSAGGEDADDAEENESADAEGSTSSDTGTNADQGGSGGAEGGSSSSGDESDGSSPSDTSGDSEGNNGNDGDAENPSGGFGGSITVYDANNPYAEVQKADSVAVLGTDASVLVQAIGGEGAICAMSEYAYDGMDASGDEETTASCFSEVFAGATDGIELLWEEDGSTSADLTDVDALVEACGADGVIVYDQDLGDQTTLFNADQREAIYNAGIQLVPVDLSTVQGMLDAASVVGEALSESAMCAKDAAAMADEYVQTVSDVVEAVTDTHGGSLAVGWDDANAFLTTYNASPVKAKTVVDVNCYIATDSETGLTVSNDYGIDASGIVLFQENNTWDETPLMFWEQVAGVWADNCTYSTTGDGLSAIWPVFQGASISRLSGGEGGAYARWLGSSPAGQSSLMAYYDGTVANTSSYPGDGLGSAHVPYLIVCASDGKTAAEVRDAVIDSMNSRIDGGSITPYSILPYSSAGYPTDSTYSQAITSIGASTTESQSPFLTGLDAADVVVENPVGLLGSWTEGTMECLLESVWLADIYSESPDGCSYAPVCDMSGFSVMIGGTDCTTVKDAVLAFCRTFYDYDAGDVYDDIVTDDGSR